MPRAKSRVKQQAQQKTKQRAKPHVSIIVLNYNGKHFLKDCFDSLWRQTFKDFEVLLVDNGSSDGSVEHARRIGAAKIHNGKLRIIANPDNTGFTGGNNLGVRKAKANLIVLLNNDTIVTLTWLKEMLRLFNKKKYHGKPIGIVGSITIPKHIFRAGKELKENDFKCGIMTLFGHHVPARKTKEMIDTGIRPVLYAGGAALLFDKRMFPQPFEECYFSYAEDNHLGLRARLRGTEVLVTTRSQYFHYEGGGRTKKSINKMMVFHGTKNQIINFFSVFAAKNIVKLLPLLCIHELGQLLYQPRRVWLTLKAYAWLVVHIPTIVRVRRKTQQGRTVADEELFKVMSSKFFDENWPGISKGARAGIMCVNSFFKGYCRLVDIHTQDLLKKP